nr:stage V sporulation protein AB [uncultured Bacillus sp.]
MIINLVFVIFLGFAGGVSVGAGYVAFLTVLGIVPRLTQLTKTMKLIHWYEWGIVLGTVLGTLMLVEEPHLSLHPAFLVFLGLTFGIFVGMMAAALTEVLNVWPILAKRIGAERKIVILLMALVIGKIAGSLFHWIYFVDLSK